VVGPAVVEFRRDRNKKGILSNIRGTRPKEASAKDALPHRKRKETGKFDPEGYSRGQKRNKRSLSQVTREARQLAVSRRNASKIGTPTTPSTKGGGDPSPALRTTKREMLIDRKTPHQERKRTP